MKNKKFFEKKLERDLGFGDGIWGWDLGMGFGNGIWGRGMIVGTYRIHPKNGQWSMVETHPCGVSIINGQWSKC